MPISEIPQKSKAAKWNDTSRQPYWSNFNAKFSMKWNLWAFSTLVSGKPQLSHSEKKSDADRHYTIG